MQRKTFVLALVAFLMAPLVAIADQTVLGVPDLNCQSSNDWRLHDYGAPATGLLVSLPQDGNTQQCDASSLPGDFDGDFEFAVGGAYLVSRTGDGSTDGGLACYGTWGHHPQGGVVEVTDVSGLPVAFTVTADFTDPSDPAGSPDCGDNLLEPCEPSPTPPSALPQPLGGVVNTVGALLASLSGPGGAACNPQDQSIGCLNSCYVPFGPGVDGAYLVFVGPTLTGNAGEPIAATQGHIAVTSGPGGGPTISLLDFIPWNQAPWPAGPTFVSTSGGAPTLRVPPGWSCVETLPWTGGNTGSGSVEVACTPLQVARSCRQPVVNVYLYSGVGSITGGTGCGFIDVSCEANLGLTSPANIRTCAARSGTINQAALMCRVDVQQTPPHFAWSAICANDP